VTLALVTGSHGFVGRHLCRELRGRGWQVMGVGRTQRPDADYRVLNLADPAAVASLIADQRPEVVFHLAAATQPTSTVVSDNVDVARGLGVGLRLSGHRPRVVLAGSSAQYGAVARELNPVTEATLGQPAGAYGFAKAAAESILCGFASGGAFDVIPVRAFNHVGPGEPATTVAGAFAERIRAVLAGRSPTVSAADLGAVRDFTDVRDIARGYVDLAEKGEPGRVYNLCSGRAATVGDVLDGLLAAAGLDRSIVEVQPAGAGERSGAVPYQVGSPDRIQREIGWNATLVLTQSMADLLAAEVLT
jgi:GDP-4-dehydro-6-deoxy-D-mannose reductase